MAGSVFVRFGFSRRNGVLGAVLGCDDRGGMEGRAALLVCHDGPSSLVREVGLDDGQPQWSFVVWWSPGPLWRDSLVEPGDPWAPTILRVVIRPGRTPAHAGEGLAKRTVSFLLFALA